jgi:pimeloyl-ACP methyl ester carboxylesterase
MRTERIQVAEGVELAVDTWPAAGPEGITGGVAPAPGGQPGLVSGRRAGDGAPADPVPAHGPVPATFVLVHGLASNARLWDGVAGHLAAAGHPVATVDLRGHGRSSKPDGPYDVPTVAADLAAVIAGLGLDRPVVAGQSWGGNVVLELAARHPESVRGVVCVDGGWLEPSRAFPDWNTCRRALAPPRLVGRPLSDIEGYLRTAHRDWPESGIRGSLANFEIHPDGTVAPWLTYERHIEILRGLWEHHPSDLYARVTAPVLLLPVDTSDASWTDRKRGEVAAALAGLPNARARWFEGDHDIHAQRPAEVADAMATAAREGLFS